MDIKAPSLLEYHICKYYGSHSVGCILTTSMILDVPIEKICEIILRKTPKLKLNVQIKSQRIIKGSCVIKYIGETSFIQVINPVLGFLWGIKQTTKYSIGVIKQDLYFRDITNNGLIVFSEKYNEKDYIEFGDVYNQIPFS